MLNRMHLDQLERPPQLPFWRTVFRSSRLRCPRCGEGKLFDGWFTMRPGCDECGLDFRQEPGFYLGSIYFNYGLTALVVTATYFTLYFATSLNDRVVVGGLLVFIVLFPLWFFRYARSLWLGFDQYWDPDEAPALPVREGRGEGGLPTKTA
ncbi:MAG TPA: DUF983 domain-containing protein [Pirellulales bacterium]|nr:DUF983 domain-containing protein [Pirellulales bacterium]